MLCLAIHSFYLIPQFTAKFLLNVTGYKTPRKALTYVVFFRRFVHRRPSLISASSLKTRNFVDELTAHRRQIAPQNLSSILESPKQHSHVICSLKMSRERENKEINAHLLTTPSKTCVARRRQLNDDSSFIADMRGSCKYCISASGCPIWRRRRKLLKDPSDAISTFALFLAIRYVIRLNGNAW